MSNDDPSGRVKLILNPSAGKMLLSTIIEQEVPTPVFAEVGADSRDYDQDPS